MQEYETALICLNGHVITNNFADSDKDQKVFCSKCGMETIYKCPSCGAVIHGSTRKFTSWSELDPHPSNFCYNCGNPYPWTKKKIESLHEFLKAYSKESSEITLLDQDISDIISDTPKTILASTHWKKFLLTTGKEAYSLIKPVLIDVLSEVAKKIIFPP
jgi:hypothetical protein